MLLIAEWTLGKISSITKTLSYASSKVDYSMGENIYMLPSDMNLKIRLGNARYNNKILVSDGKFSLGKNEKLTPASLNQKIRQQKRLTKTD